MKKLTLEQLSGVVAAECAYQGDRSNYVYKGWRCGISSVEVMGRVITLKVVCRDGRPAHERLTHEGWKEQNCSSPAPIVLGDVENWDVVADTDESLTIRSNGTGYFDPRDEAKEHVVSQVTFRRMVVPA